MRKRVLSLLLVLVMLLGLLPTGVLAADTATGVSSQEELAGMTDGSYILTDDITLDDSWLAIDFSGTLDGNGYTITLDGQPLFGELTGTVQNLLLDGSVTSEGNIGALCNTMKTGSTVQNCWSGADVTATKSVAYASGFTGKIVDGRIQDCLATGALTGGKWGDTFGIAVGGTSDIEYSPIATNCWFVNGKKGVQYGDGHTCTKVENGDYSSALDALNAAAAESGLLTWKMDEADGIPKPARGASGGDEGGETDNRPAADRVAELLPKTEEFVYNQIKDAVQFGCEWMIFGLARAGYELPDEFVDAYYQSALMTVQEEAANSRPWSYKVTETQRLALALTAIGKDPTDVGGVNLLDYSWNKEKNFPNLSSAVLGERQGSNELIFGLLATEAHDSFTEKQPESVTMTSEQMVEKLLTYQKSDGGFGLDKSGDTSGVDITAMALQALAKHMDSSNVQSAVEEALAYLSKVQTANGAFGTPESPEGTVESTAQVVVALCELGIDPDTDERFVKQGVSLVDDLLSYALEDGSFEHTHGGGYNGMATEQALYALAALARYYESNGRTLYNMNDVVLESGEDSGKTLEQLLEKAAGLESSKSNYTEVSWANFQGYVKDAQEVAANPEATEDEKTEASEALEKAFDWLITVENYNLLKAEYDRFEAEILPNRGNYTSESWVPANQAYNDAWSILYDAEDEYNETVTDSDVLAMYNTLHTAIENLEALTSTEITSVDELKAMTASGQYTLESDLTLPADWNSTLVFSGTFDGNGHVITMSGGGSLFQSISGTVRNLGLTGTVNGSGAFAGSLSGTIFNCYSWADVNNGDHPAGGAVGMTTGTYGGTISNSYVSGTVTGNPAGGLAGSVTHYDFSGSYWVNGTSCSTADEPETDTWAGMQKTLDEMKDASFLTALNGKVGSNGVTWNRSENGLPYFGENIPESGQLPYEVKFTDILDESNIITISDKSQTLDTDVFGEPGGYIGTLTLSSYDGTVDWSAASTSAVANEPVIISAKGQVFVRAAGQVKVTASDATTGTEILSFVMNVTVPEYTLTLKIKGEDYTGKTYNVDGYADFGIVPYVQVGDGEPVEAYNALFDWTSDNESVATVTSVGGVNIKSAGNAVLTAKLGNTSASVTVAVFYVAVESIDPNFEGTYYLHRRNPNSIGQTDHAGADFNPLRNLDENGEEDLTSAHNVADVYPADATYRTVTVKSLDDSVIRFVAGTFQCLVPRKAGTATLAYSSNDPQLPAQITAESQVTLEYLNPVTGLKAEETSLTVKEGEAIDAGLIFTGVNDEPTEKYPDGLHVSESDMTWTQSGTGQVLAYRDYPIYMPDDEGYSLAEGSVANDHWLIKGVKSGTVTLTGIAKDTTNGTFTVTLTITVEEGEQGPEQTVQEQVAAALKSTGSYVYNAIGEAPKFNNEWMIFGLARAGYDLSDEFIEAYYASAIAEAKKEAAAQSRPWSNKVTETQRLALALTAIGKDPTNVGGVNLLDYSWNKENYFGEGNTLGSTQGSNELIFGLLAIEANSRFEQPEVVTMTTSQMVAKLLSDYRTESGGFGLSDNQTAGVDMTAMALQALAKHKTEAGVQDAIDKALTYLSNVQGISGSYGNSESTAQVIVALCELGIDPDTDARFIKNGCSVVDGLLDYALDDGSFCHTMSGGSNGMATEQAYYTLAALNRFYSGQASLYNMNDVVFDGESGTEVTGILLRPATSEVQVGKTVQLTATVLPGTAENRKVTFTSSDDAIATVSGTGLVTGVKAGTVTITVTTEEGKYTASATITVKESGGGTTPEDKTTVTLSIDKKTINKGYVLQPTKVEITKGETVWDVLQRELDARDIDYDYSFYEQYNSVYVESIDGDGEFDHGSGSGWMYNVDGVYPDYGASLYILEGGETIQWRYTTNLGLDLGRDYGSGGSSGSGTETGGTTEIKPTAKADKNGAANVTVSETEMKNAIAAAKTEGSNTVVIAPQITGEATKVTAEVPTQSLKDMVKNTDAALEVQTDVGSVSIPNEALAAIAQEAGGSTVTIMVETKDAADLKDQVSATQLEGATVVEVIITSGKTEITTFAGEYLTITIPVTGSAFADGEAYKVIVLSADGSKETMTGTCAKQNGKLRVQVKIAHLSTFVVTAQKAMPFTDVTGHWAAEAIAWAYENGLMNGTGETTFAPNATLNRAMLATILYRQAGEPAVEGEGVPFTDVALDAWYTDAVIWANKNGIVTGYGNGLFGSSDSITREQLAVMIYRYAKLMKEDTAASGDLSAFTDDGDASDWAAEALSWAYAEGLITGRTATTIAPQGTATRAEVATILMRFANLEK